MAAEDWDDQGKAEDSNLFLNKVLRPTKDFDPFNRLYPIGTAKLITIYGPVVQWGHDTTPRLPMIPFRSHPPRLGY